MMNLSISRSERVPLRLASWNLKSCERGLTGIIQGLRSLDAELIALQEVECGTFRSGGMNQATFLAKEAGFAYSHFFKARDCGPGEYGLALLSRHPLTDCRSSPLPVVPNVQKRVLGSAVAHMPWGRLSVHVTHFTHVFHARKLRLRQAMHVLEAIDADPLPRVLLGDFNDVPGSLMHRALGRRLVDVFKHAGEGRGGTFPLVPKLVTPRIDYIWTSPDLAPTRARVLRTRASDHHILTAEVEARPTVFEQIAISG